MAAQRVLLYIDDDSNDPEIACQNLQRKRAPDNKLKPSGQLLSYFFKPTMHVCINGTIFSFYRRRGRSCELAHCVRESRILREEQAAQKIVLVTCTVKVLYYGSFVLARELEPVQSSSSYACADAPTLALRKKQRCGRSCIFNR